jgi:hypothetical protein
MKSLPLLLALCFALFLVSANDAAEDFSQPGFNSELIKVGKQYSLNTMKDVSSTCDPSFGSIQMSASAVGS